MPKKGNTWIVTAGDNVNSIAQKVYGKENERMFAQIVRLNGGVKTLQPGMVLKLPGLQSNESIFVGNDWAANMGMATTGELKAFYDANPGASATAAAKAGTWSYGGLPNAPIAMGGGPGALPKPPAPTPPVVSTTADPRTLYPQRPYQPQPPYTSPTESGITRPGGTPGISTPAPPRPGQGPSFAQNFAQGNFGNIATDISKVIGMQNPTIASYYNNLAGMVAGIWNPNPSAASASAQNPPYPGANAQNRAAVNAQTAQNKDLFGNAVPMTKPEGAVTNGQSSQKSASGAAGGQVVDPLTYYSNVALIPGFVPTQTLLNTPPEVAAKYAPYVNEAVANYYMTANGGGTISTFTKSQADLLFQAGIFNAQDPNDIKIVYDLAAGIIPGAGAPPAGETTTGKWSPFDLGGTQLPTQARPNQPLSQQEIDKRNMIIGNNGRNNNANVQATAMHNILGQNIGNIGPTLGLAQWRSNL